MGKQEVESGARRWSVYEVRLCRQFCSIVFLVRVVDVVHMKKASALDDLLPTLCHWCGQAGHQVWCKKMAMERRSKGGAAGAAGAALSIQCVLKEPLVFGSFYGSCL